MSKHFAKRQVRDTQNTRSGSEVPDIYKAPIGLTVLVYPPEKDKWEGLSSLLDVCKKNVTVLTPKVATEFCSTVGKPHHNNTLEHDKVLSVEIANNNSTVGTIIQANSTFMWFLTADRSNMSRFGESQKKSLAISWNEECLHWYQLPTQPDKNLWFAACGQD